MLQKHFLQPASKIVEMFGGCRALADELDLNPGTVSRWMTPLSERGTGGFIPQRHWPRLMLLARGKRKRLTLKDLSGL